MTIKEKLKKFDERHHTKSYGNHPFWHIAVLLLTVATVMFVLVPWLINQWGLGG